VFRAALSLCHHLMLWKALNCTYTCSKSTQLTNARRLLPVAV
jgi:hypothetical protein